MEYPPGKEKDAISESHKAEVETKARDLIDNVLKPKYVLPPPVEAQFNYIIEVGAKWYRNYFCFFSAYACPGPNALFPTFESKFARTPRRRQVCPLFMRYAGKECVGVLDARSVYECMKAIQDDEWFVP